MSERMFHLFTGLLLLAALYFDVKPAIYGVIVVLALEVITNQRLTVIVSRLRHGGLNHEPGCHDRECAARFNFEAERALRLVLALLLFVSFVLLYGQLWIVTWFVGFALVAAGLSGICPIVLTLKKLGFR
ncbi:MAG: YgaP-like transmembrane domain [Bacteroidota bacterium]